MKAKEGVAFNKRKEGWPYGKLTKSQRTQEKGWSIGPKLCKSSFSRERWEQLSQEGAVAYRQQEGEPWQLKTPTLFFVRGWYEAGRSGSGCWVACSVVLGTGPRVSDFPGLGPATALSPLLLFLVTRQNLSKSPRLSLNLWPSFLNLLSSWDHRPAPPRPGYFLFPRLHFSAFICQCLAHHKVNTNIHGAKATRTIIQCGWKLNSKRWLSWKDDSFLGNLQKRKDR